MKFSQILALAFLTFTCFCAHHIHGRHIHSYKNMKQHLHLISHISIQPSPAPEAAGLSPSGPPVYDVRSFGAVGNGISDDTEAFKLAWDTACQAEQSATLLVPNGFIFMLHPTIFTGPCKSALTFQIDGTVMAPDGPDSWRSNNSKRQWLVFYRINGLSVEGSGIVDGRGEKWWDLPCKPRKGSNGTTTVTQTEPCDSPVAIKFFENTDLAVKRLEIKNSPQFHFRFDGCQNVQIDRLTINSPAESPNTDGIHIENTNNVTIYNSIISAGDDCVSIGAGCYNVDIRNITCGPSHGISIGSLGSHNSTACVSNITVSDSVVNHSDNGVRIKTWQGGAGFVSKVTFNNIQMDTVRNPIIIDQYYCLSKNCLNQTSAVFISDVVYSNIKGTYDVRSPPMRFACSDSVPCTNLTLAEIDLLPAQTQNLAPPFCWNAYGTMQKPTNPPAFCLLEGKSLRLPPQYDVIGCQSDLVLLP